MQLWLFSLCTAASSMYWLFPLVVSYHKMILNFGVWQRQIFQHVCKDSYYNGIPYSVAILRIKQSNKWQLQCQVQSESQTHGHISVAKNFIKKCWEEQSQKLHFLLCNFSMHLNIVYQEKRQGTLFFSTCMKTQFSLSWSLIETSSKLPVKNDREGGPAG